LKGNEHFLPQHYLRQFRIGDSKLIGIAKVAPFRFIGAGPTRGSVRNKASIAIRPALINYSAARNQISHLLSPTLLSDKISIRLN
jgi:hypothetical protein